MVGAVVVLDHPWSHMGLEPLKITIPRLYQRRWKDWPYWLRFAWQVATAECGYVVLSRQAWGTGFISAWGIQKLSPAQQRFRLAYFKQNILEDLERRAQEIPMESNHVAS